MIPFTSNKPPIPSICRYCANRNQDALHLENDVYADTCACNDIPCHEQGPDTRCLRYKEFHFYTVFVRNGYNEPVCQTNVTSKEQLDEMLLFYQNVRERDPLDQRRVQVQRHDWRPL